MADFSKRIGLPVEQIEKPGQYTLTVAHLDHDPGNPNARLAVLCSVCHRQYDNRFMPKLTYDKRERHGQLTFKDCPVESAPLNGLQVSLFPEVVTPYPITDPDSEARTTA